VILHRCFAWDRRAAPDQEGGPLWLATAYQGGGRHDNPESFGCLYLATSAPSALVEQLAPFRGSVLRPEFLVRRGLPLGLAEIELADDAELLDLDDPGTLRANALRPSQVATRRREVTQPQALELYRRHERAAGLRWWSTFESLWTNVTLFDRAAPLLRLVDVRRVDVNDQALREAADLLGLAPG
jgi:RES domain